MGIMVTYGSYISHKENLTTTALWVSVLAFISCILAGLMVIPPVISFGLNPSAGPGL
ncbi:MAG TPA: sodium-dependent transporter, partial [Sutterellaceae bacterium]|nr:sodium-dependent transporter [Sutterellaceae bacterium]